MHSDSGIDTYSGIVGQVISEFQGNLVTQLGSTEGLLTGRPKQTKQSKKEIKIIATQIDKVELSLNILNTYNNNTDCISTEESEIQKWIRLRDLVRTDHKARWGSLNPEIPWSSFNVSGSSAVGYPLRLLGRGWELLTGKIAVAGAKPNTRIQIGSEILWNYGYSEIACGIIEMLKGKNLVVDQVRLSRVDIMADIIVPDGLICREWEDSLKGYAKVTRSFKSETDGHYTGFATPEGDIMLRVYDKPEEINYRKETKGYAYVFHKWGMSEPPEGYRIFRVEFELRRKFLRENGINEPADLEGREGEIWRYLTDTWCRVVAEKKKGTNKDREQVNPVWQCVQEAFGTGDKAKKLKREITGRKVAYLSEDPSHRIFLKALGTMIGYNRYLHGLEAQQDISDDLINKLVGPLVKRDLMIFCGGYTEMKEELNEIAGLSYQEYLRKGLSR